PDAAAAIAVHEVAVATDLLPVILAVEPIELRRIRTDQLLRTGADEPVVDDSELDEVRPLGVHLELEAPQDLVRHADGRRELDVAAVSCVEVGLQNLGVLG